MRSFLVLFLIFYSSNLWADRNTPVKVMAFANGTLMSTPTLPLLYGKKGQSVFKFQPAYFTGDLQNGDEGQTENSARVLESEFTGFAGSFIWSSLLTESFGWYLTGLANSTTGDFAFTVTDPTDGDFRLNVNDVKSTQFMASLGMSYTLFANSFLPIQFFGGPSVVKTNIEQTVTTSGASSNDDFDMKISPTSVSLIAGVQIGIRLSKWLIVNPYFVLSQLVNDSDKCQPFEVVVRQTGGQFDFTDVECQDGQNSSTSEIFYDTAFASYGVYVEFPGLGFSVNVFAESEPPENLGEPSIQLYAITFSFNL